MFPETSGAGKADGAHTVWFDHAKNNAQPQETEQDKLRKSNVWDYAANSLQAGAYMG